ncbi:MAG: hypothetical protein Q4D98_00530 [Planctomycetia bacterium]|nr:hypothetical protein [Planctomycetia bacterium]
MLNRRDFSRVVAAMGAAAVLPSGVSGEEPASRGKKWYRGNLHMHTFRSDGVAFAEEAAALYKRLGYHFVCLTDHNSVHESDDRWVKLGQKKLTEAHVARYRETFDFPLEEREENGEKAYRLKTFAEMGALLNEPDRFLLLSGMEYSGTVKNRHEVHTNFINVRQNHPWVAKETTAENIDWSLELYRSMANEQTIYTMNHPLWRFYDIDPMDLVKRPEIRFFEVANVEARPLFHAPVEFWTHDKFWDIVNAFRARRGEPLLYGTATDDTHGYNMFYRKPDFVGYVMVHAAELSEGGLISAMKAGDFYASTGLTLNTMAFDRATGTLSVEVAPEPGYAYTIQFIGTKRDFDPTVLREVEHQAQGVMPSWWKGGELPKRKLAVYSDSIGQVLGEVRGTVGSYTLRPDDLYVRAKIFTQKISYNEWEHPSSPIAWTQPYSR